MVFKRLDVPNIDKWLLHDINGLLAQLSEKAKRRSRGDLKRIVEGTDMIMVVAMVGKLTIGMASIYFRETLTKKVGVIEDVVVDRKYRGKGIGQKLTEMLIEEAKRRNTNRVEYPRYYLELTSKPKRKAANALYKKFGFKLAAKAVGKNGTNLYRLSIRS
jgi:ribosomal protein S18 acetylase RimI-like enzyme